MTATDETLRLEKELKQAEAQLASMQRERLRLEESLAEKRNQRLAATYIWLGVVAGLLLIGSVTGFFVWRDTQIQTTKARHAVPTIHASCQPGDGNAWICTFRQEPRAPGDLEDTPE